MTARFYPRLAAASLGLALGATAGCHKSKLVYAPPPAPAAAPAPRVTAAHEHSIPNASPKKPVPAHTPDDLNGKPVSTEVGLASWYGPPYHNHQAADGSVFDQNAMTAAHRTLPLGTTVRVTNLANEQSVIVKVTDRGPFVQGRTLDLSLAAAQAIGVYRAGVARVKVEAFAHPAADPEGRWCVQIGVFLEAADAIQVKNDLALRYRTAKVIQFAGPTGYWVRINPAQADRKTAAAIADSIHLPDADPYLVRTN